TVNDFMDSVHHIWCLLSSQEYQDLPDGAETTLTVQKTGLTVITGGTGAPYSVLKGPCLIA
ncbi:hypothetical protein, partial [Klebsiella pneumoniae]|uniref:hypothetical protein n=1 Tax=Klebsiella pneumoniae TaxID=573 RepID=UPI001FADBB55